MIVKFFRAMAEISETFKKESTAENPLQGFFVALEITKKFSESVQPLLKVYKKVSKPCKKKRNSSRRAKNRSVKRTKRTKNTQNRKQRR